VTALPSGTVTFLLSDAEASSALWQRGLESADEAFAHLAVLVDSAAERFGGVVLKSRGEGDSHFVVFDRASSAVAAAIDLQRAIGSTTWPPDAAVAVRVAIHSGEPLVRDGDYFGPVVNETARLRSLGHGGQVLASPVTVLLARAGVDDEVDFLSLGVFRIRDFPKPQEVFQVTAPGLASTFRPLQALDTVPPPIVAVVRLDVSGFGQLLQTSDYAAVVEAGRSFARLARARFDDLGGYALHVVGDSVTAAFGTPVLAVEFVRQVAAPLKLDGFSVHAGLHAGSVGVTAKGPTGHAVMVAEALLAIARPAEILATRTIAELTRGDSRVVCMPRADETPSILGQAWELYSIAVA
jgi:class 3 adenylate cyclase